MNYFNEYFDHFTYSDTLDIILVSLILYRFLAIVQGTRAVQVLAGIGTLFCSTGQSLLRSLFAKLATSLFFLITFFVIVIILFQDQFKAALASFGAAEVMVCQTQLFT